MEFVGPIIHLLRGGSPWLILLTTLAAIGLTFIRALLKRQLILGGLHEQRVEEIKERYADEVRTWAQRYAELDTRRLKAEQERDEAVMRWLRAEQERLTALRTVQEAVGHADTTGHSYGHPNPTERDQIGGSP